MYPFFFFLGFKVCKIFSLIELKVLHTCLVSAFFLACDYLLSGFENRKNVYWGVFEK